MLCRQHSQNYNLLSALSPILEAYPWRDANFQSGLRYLLVIYLSFITDKLGIIFINNSTNINYEIIGIHLMLLLVKFIKLN